MKELLLLTDLSSPRTWIQSSTFGTSSMHLAPPGHSRDQDVTDALSRSKSVFKKKEKAVLPSVRQLFMDDECFHPYSTKPIKYNQMQRWTW